MKYQEFDLGNGGVARYTPSDDELIISTRDGKQFAYLTTHNQRLKLYDALKSILFGDREVEDADLTTE